MLKDFGNDLQLLNYSYKSAGFMISPRDFIFLSKTYRENEKIILTGSNFHFIINIS